MEILLEIDVFPVGTVPIENSINIDASAVYREFKGPILIQSGD